MELDITAQIRRDTLRQALNDLIAVAAKMPPGAPGAIHMGSMVINAKDMLKELTAAEIARGIHHPETT